MTLPDGVTTCQVSYGKALGFLGTESTISGTLTASHNIVHVASGTSLMSADEPTPFAFTGQLVFDVPHVDQAGFQDGSGNAITNWAYILQARIKFPSGTFRDVKKAFQVFVGQDTIDLDLVPDGPIMPGVTAPTAALIRGVPGGVAGLDADGNVVDADGNAITAPDLSGFARTGSQGRTDLSLGTAATHAATDFAYRITYKDLPTSGLRYYHHQGGLNPYGSGVRNSLSGARRAVALGAWILDFDARNLADGVIVNHHDADTTTTTANNQATLSDGSPNPFIVTPSQVQYHLFPLLDQRAYLGPGHTPEPILTLEQAMHEFGPSRLYSIELKDSSDQLAAVAALVNQHGLGQNTYINFGAGGEAFAPQVIAAGLLVYVYTCNTAAKVAAAVAAGAKLISLPLDAPSDAWAAVVTAKTADPDLRVLSEGTTGVAFGLQSRRELAKVPAAASGVISEVMSYLDQSTNTTSIAPMKASGKMADGMVVRNTTTLPASRLFTWLGLRGLLMNVGSSTPSWLLRPFGVTTPATPWTVTCTVVYDVKPTTTTQFSGLRLGVYNDDAATQAVSDNLGGHKIAVRANGTLADLMHPSTNFSDGIKNGNQVLSAALTSGVAVTAIPVVATTALIRSGAQFTISTGQTVTTTADVSAGATSIPVASISPSANVASGSTLTAGSVSVTTTNGTTTNPLIWPVLSAGLAAGVAITALPVTATTSALKAGAKFALPGTDSMLATVSADTASGATSIPITTFTPDVAVASGATLGAAVKFTVQRTSTNWVLTRADTAESLTIADTYWFGGIIDPLTTMTDGESRIFELSRA